MKRLIFLYPCFLGMICLLMMSAGCNKDDDSQSTPKATDADGNVYNSVRIGNQIWMAENLRTTKYRDGSPIPLVTDDSQWSNLSTPAYCWYDNSKQEYGNRYGALYNWFAVNTGKLCPAGWHVPTDDEFTILSDFLGGENVAGTKLKDNDSTLWLKWDSPGTNETGFSGRPGGTRHRSQGNFHNIGLTGYWWSSKNYSTTGGWSRAVSHMGTHFTRSNNDSSAGYSVRCLKD